MRRLLNDPKPRVTLALPVFNGAASIGDVATSVLSQDYDNIELLISDNASTDATAEVCREIAKSDARVRYHRHPRNLGVVNNFEWTKHNCRGTLMRWIGDSDVVRPSYASRCVELFVDHPRLFLVTTQLEYITNEGLTRTSGTTATRCTQTTRSSVFARSSMRSPRATS